MAFWTKKESPHSKKIIYKTFNLPDKPMVYVLRGSEGDLLIDCAYALSTKSLEKWVRNQGFDIKWLFLTHGHFDHAYNARYLHERLGCKVMIHEKDAAYLAGEYPRKVSPSRKSNAVQSAAANAACEKLKNPECPVDYVLSDGDTDFLRGLGFDADVVMLPGHTLGSMGILQGRALYCGDAMSAKRGDYYTAMFGEDVDAIFATERKMFEINPLIFAPGHGQLVVNEKAFS